MSEKYDVVIIGAGIGGLVCGCYLAKAGLKVLIVEQQDKPGGYCTSFEREGYRFDVGVHYLGGIKKGVLGSILEELKVKDKIRFNQFDPTDKIIMPDKVTYLRKDYSLTIEEFKKVFFNESKNITSFFEYIRKTDFLSVYKKFGKASFKDFLDHFFEDEKLKATLGILLNNIGLSPAVASAVASIILFKEFILDPGYYPLGGMGVLASTLADQFKFFGGEILLKRKVQKIFVEQNSYKRVLLDAGLKIDSSYLVSNADAYETFQKLISNHTEESKVLKKLTPSFSIFILYLGLKKRERNSSHNIWLSNTYNLDEYYARLSQNIKRKNLSFFMISFPSEHDETIDHKNKSVVQIYFITPYFTKDFWLKNKVDFIKKVIQEVKAVVPDTETTKLTFAATPFTLNRYTNNKEGAAFGWASTVDQIHPAIFPQKTSINRLFLTGHWCTVGSGQGGIPRVAFSGKTASELILKKVKK